MDVNGRNNSSDIADGYTDITYFKRSWKQDAVFITLIAEEMVGGGLRHLDEILSDADVREALAITKTLDKKTKSTFRAKAKDSLHSQNSSAASTVAFTRFLKRFKDGPTPDEDDEASSDERVGNNGGRTDREQRQSHEQRPSHEQRSSRDPDYSGYQGHRERQDRHGSSSRTRGKNASNGDHRNRHPYPRDDPDDNDYSSSGSDRHGRGRGHYRPTSRARPNSRFTNNGQNKRLRVDEVGIFDGTPATPSAIAYYKHLTFLAVSFGEATVLQTLPLCMRDKALTWFSSLDEEVTELMAESLDEWKI
jgi:hypothetical protein